ncbi:hypothetical protein C8R45DRAFT_920227, partial [Mycena sanguinolenta]
MPDTPDFQGQRDRNQRRYSRQFSAIVPIAFPTEISAAPDQPAYTFTSSSDPRAPRLRSQPHFDPAQQRPPRPNAPNFFSRPLLTPERLGSSYRAQMTAPSPTESQYPGPNYPQVVDFDDLDQISLSGSRASPTLRRRSSVIQSATIYELPEQEVPGLPSVPEHPPAPAFPPINPLLLPALPPAPGARSASAPPLPVVASGPPDGDKGNGGSGPDPTANPPAQPPANPPT